MQAVAKTQEGGSAHGGGHGGAHGNTVALVVIGNEILTGKIADENIVTLAKALTRKGLRLVEVRVVADDVSVIAAAVNAARAMASLVVTSGGVGPTHDDLTMAGVAAAFGVGTAENVTMVASIEAARGKAMREGDPYRRLCVTPVGAEIRNGGDPWLATAVMENVYILPGVPALFSRRLETLLDEFVARAGSVRVHTVTLSVRVAESHLAADLDAVVAAFSEVSVGSYPKWDETGHWVLVTFDAVDAAKGLAALDALRGRLDATVIMGEEREAGEPAA